jgi:hypothetical protein
MKLHNCTDRKAIPATKHSTLTMNGFLLFHLIVTVFTFLFLPQNLLQLVCFCSPRVQEFMRTVPTELVFQEHQMDSWELATAKQEWRSTLVRRWFLFAVGVLMSCFFVFVCWKYHKHINLSC